MKKTLITSLAVIALLAGGPAFADDGAKAEAKLGIGLGGFSRFFNDRGDKERNNDENRAGDNRDNDNDDNDKMKGENRDNDDDGDKREDKTTAISGTVTAISGTTLTVTGKNGEVYTVNAANASFKGQHDSSLALGDIKLNDVVHVKGEVSGTTVVATRITDKNAMQRSWLAMLKNVTLGVVTSVSGSTFVVDPIGASTTGTVTTDASTKFKQNGKATTSSALTVGSNVVIVGTTTADSGSNMLISASFVNIVNKSWGFLKHFLGQ